MSDFDFGKAMADMPGKGRGNGGFKPAMNLPLRIDKVHADKAAKNPAKDYIEAFLLVDAFGKKANDIIQIKLKARQAPSDPEKLPLEVWDLQLGKKVKGRYQVGEYAAIVAENATLLTDGTFECGWIKVMEYAYADKPGEKAVKDALVIGPISVGYLNEPREGRNFHSQDRFVQMTDESVVVAGMGEAALASFRAQAIELMRDRSATAGGRPLLNVRLINNTALGTPDAVKVATIWTPWDSANGCLASPEVAVDTWMADERNGFWMRFIANADAIAASNGLLEMWPAASYQNGKMVTDNEVKAKNSGRHLTHETFSAPAVDVSGAPVHKINNDGTEGWRRNAYQLYAEGMHQVMLLDNRNEWSANQTYTLERFPSKLFALEELSTPNVSEAALALFASNAEKRVADKREALKNAKAPENQQSQSQDPAQSQGQDFGGDPAPDPTGGGFRPR